MKHPYSSERDSKENNRYDDDNSMINELILYILNNLYILKFHAGLTSNPRVCESVSRLHVLGYEQENVSLCLNTVT